MRKGKKVYKKFLSFALATAMVVTSGVFYPRSGEAASVESVVTEQVFAEDMGNWYIVEGQDGVILDNQGVMYRLNEDAKTATVIGFALGRAASAEETPVQNDIVDITISDTVPLNLTGYKSYRDNGKDALVGTRRGSSKVTAIEANAFSGSSALTKVTVPETILSIEEGAFSSCPALTAIQWQVQNGVKLQIGVQILSGSSNCILYSDNDEVKDYAEKNGYSYKKEEDAPPTPSPSPTEEPSLPPTEEPGQGSTPSPSTTPSGGSTAAPSEAPTIPVVPPTAAPTAMPTPTIATSAPNVTASPTPIAPPVVETPIPDETAVPTLAPTETANTPAPTGQEPTITEVPVVTEAPTPIVTQEPSDSTPVPPVSVSPTIAPKPKKVVVQNNVTYEVNQSKKSVSVSGMQDVKTSKIVIPATVKINGVNYPVTSVDNGAFKNNTAIKKVKLGKNITVVKAAAFRGCKNLTSVQVPLGLGVICKNSFNGCSKLKSIKVPKTVTRIGKAAFKNCVSLKKFTVGDNPKKKTGGISIEGKEIRYGASTVTINIGKKAFENCKKLNKVIINALVEVIGKSAFRDCKSLRDILIYSKILKQVKGGALKGVSNCKISVPNKKVEPYKILFKNKGQGKKVVVAKL